MNKTRKNAAACEMPKTINREENGKCNVLFAVCCERGQVHITHHHHHHRFWNADFDLCIKRAIGIATAD